MTRLVKVAMTTASMINWVSGSLLSFFFFFFFFFLSYHHSDAELDLVSMNC